MDRPIWVRLLAVLEHNPKSTTVTLNRASAEEMLHEIKRLQDGGCARNQGLTQYCAEAAEKDVEIASLKAEVERKDAALEKAEGNFYNMANTIDDEDYRGSAPGIDGVVVGHREEYHKNYVQWLVRYAEEARAALTPSQEPRT